MPSRLTNLFLFIHAVFRKSAKSFLHREVVEIFGRVIADDRYFDISALDPRLESVVVESTKFLEPYRHEIPSSFRDSFARLKERLAQGCVLFLVRAPKEDGLGHEMIGYSLAERGVFSALGIRKRISPEILFVHYAEVLPAHRRKGITKFLMKARLEYCERNGLKRTVDVRSPRNRLAVQAFPPGVGHHRLGIVQRVSLLRGLFVYQTPWQKIQKAIDPSKWPPANPQGG